METNLDSEPAPFIFRQLAILYLEINTLRFPSIFTTLMSQAVIFIVC